MSAGTSSPPRNFCERLPALCVLSSFIDEHEQWIDSLLQQLGWQRDSLSTKGHPPLTQCPLSEHHFIPRDSLERHMHKCQYAAQGVQSGIETVSCDDGFLYDAAVIPSIEIKSSVEKAITRLAKDSKTNQQSAPHSVGSLRRDFIDQSEVVVESYDSLVTQEHFSSLEESCPAPRDIIAQHPTQIIRFVKSWRTVPQDFATLSLSTINLGEVKGWLFQHLPQEHVYSTAVGGEIQVVETIMKWLTPRQDGAIDPLTPNALMSTLRPLLRLKTRAFVLKLWQFLHIRALQRKHNIPDSSVEVLTPLPLGQLSGGEPRIIERIKGLVEQQQQTSEDDSVLPLPMDHVRYTLSTEERRMIYDYVVEVAGETRRSRVDNLELCDETGAKKSERDGGGEGGGEQKNYLEKLKAERDYKRRRQTYRAKNVHITRRTPVQALSNRKQARPGNKAKNGLPLKFKDKLESLLEKLEVLHTRHIFRDVIEARMEEIRVANQQLGITACERSDAEESAAEGMADPVSSPGRINEREPSPYYSRSHRNRARSRSQDRRSRYHHRDRRSATPRKSRKKSKSPKHGRKEKKHRRHRHHSKSDSKSGSRSRERHSRKRSRSHSRSRRKHKHRSRSHSDSRGREKHRRKSRSGSRSHSSARGQEKRKQSTDI